MTPIEHYMAQALVPGRFVNVLDRLELPLFLGIHPPEIAARQRVFVTVQMVCDYPAGVMEDRIEAVVDYDFLRDGIIAMAQAERFALQEILCERIATLCWRFDPVTAVEVQSHKPDIYPDASIGCRIFRLRPAA